MKTLVVLGGNGFIGSDIVRIASEEGHDVVSIDHSGRPASAGAWADRVTWVEADVLDPEAWRSHLDGADAVIHAVGILLEKPKQGLTYERVNGDSVEIAVFEAEKAGVERFVFLSAERELPMVPSRFLSAKRQGESALRRSSLRHYILRPTFVHGPERPATMLVGGVLDAAAHVPGLDGRLNGNRALRVEQVALAAVRAATDLDYEGAISPGNIAYVAGDDWKTYREPVRLRRLVPFLAGGAVAAAAGVLYGVLRRR